LNEQPLSYEPLDESNSQVYQSHGSAQLFAAGDEVLAPIIGQNQAQMAIDALSRPSTAIGQALVGSRPWHLARFPGLGATTPRVRMQSHLFLGQMLKIWQFGS
jgi:hypothetical protein